MEKYLDATGKTIDEANNNDYNWELMALEETADLQKYLVRRIKQLENMLNDYIADDDETDAMLTQANEKIKQFEQTTAWLNNDLHEAEEENKWLTNQLKQAKAKISELKTLSRITKCLQLEEENLKLAQENKRLNDLLNQN
jgi:chromosome segregation ATPase